MLLAGVLPRTNQIFNSTLLKELLKKVSEIPHTREYDGLAMEDALDEGLPRAYSKELCHTKCEAVFEHVYESYQGEGKSVYSLGT